MDQLREERYYKRLQRSEIGIAVSSALVAALVNLPSALAVVGKISAVISSAGTVLLTAFQWKKELVELSELKSHWTASECHTAKKKLPPPPPPKTKNK